MNTTAQKFAYLFAVLLMLVSQPVQCGTPQPKKQDDASWYRNDYECHGYKIALHTWCRVIGEGDNPFKQCAEQHMEVTGPDGKTNSKRCLIAPYKCISAGMTTLAGLESGALLSG